MSLNQKVAAAYVAVVILLAGAVYVERVLVTAYVQPHFVSATHDPADATLVMLLAF